MSDWRTGTVRHWINLETFILCVDEVDVIKKVNLRRGIGVGINDPPQLLPGLELRMRAGDLVEIDYLKEDHRDQVFNAIWEEIVKMGKGI